MKIYPELVEWIENCKPVLSKVEGLKIIFFGSSKYSTIVANALHQNIGLSAIVTLPDRPIGRHKTITPNPVKIFAQKNNIPFITADTLDKETIENLSRLKPDFLVIADYGKILPKELLVLPTYAPLNVHHSLLPKYRGPSPAASAILAGDPISGVTIIQMSEKLDAGDILAQKEYTLKKNETTESLLIALNTMGGEILMKVLHEYTQGKIKKIRQQESQTDYTQKIKKTDGFIDSQNPPPPQQIDRMIRAYYPWPTAWTRLPLSPSGQEKIVKFLPEKKIQVEGGKPMSIKDFLNGYPKLKTTIEKLI